MKLKLAEYSVTNFRAIKGTKTAVLRTKYEDGAVNLIIDSESGSGKTSFVDFFYIFKGIRYKGFRTGNLMNLYADPNKEFVSFKLTFLNPENEKVEYALMLQESGGILSESLTHGMKTIFSTNSITGITKIDGFDAAHTEPMPNKLMLDALRSAHDTINSVWSYIMNVGYCNSHNALTVSYPEVCGDMNIALKRYGLNIKEFENFLRDVGVKDPLIDMLILENLDLGEVLSNEQLMCKSIFDYFVCPDNPTQLVIFDHLDGMLDPYDYKFNNVLRWARERSDKDVIMIYNNGISYHYPDYSFPEDIGNTIVMHME